MVWYCPARPPPNAADILRNEENRQNDEHSASIRFLHRRIHSILYTGGPIEPPRHPSLRHRPLLTAYRDGGDDGLHNANRACGVEKKSNEGHRTRFVQVPLPLTQADIIEANNASKPSSNVSLDSPNVRQGSEIKSRANSEQSPQGQIYGDSIKQRQRAVQEAHPRNFEQNFHHPFADPLNNGNRRDNDGVDEDVQQMVLAPQTDENGRLVLTAAQLSHAGNHNNGFAQTWEAMGGHTMTEATQPPKSKKSRSKRSKRTKKGSSQQTQMTLTESLALSCSAMPGTSSSGGGGENVPPCTLQELEKNTEKRTKKRPRSKKKAAASPDPPAEKPPLVLTQETFAGIEECNICNVGQSQEAMDMFLRHLGEQPHITLTLLVADGDPDSGITTCFATSSKRYCTDKGPPCFRWYCSCDKHIRGVDLARAPLLGVLIVCPSIEDIQSQVGDFMCCLLPLGRCHTPEFELEPLPPEYQRLADWPLMPFNCEVTLSQRWKAFHQILTCGLEGPQRTACVTFQSIVSLIPYHYHRWHDLEAGLHWILPSVWDLKLVAWMMKPMSSDSEIEWDAITSGFPHMRPSPSPIPDEASNVLIAMLRAKDDLMFLFKLYPVLNNILAHKGLQDSLQTIEAPLQSVLAAMEMYGVGFLPRRLFKTQARLEKRIGELTAEARVIAQNEEFLLSSPQQVAQLLYDVLKIPVPPSTKGSSNATQQSQHRSTSEAVLEAIKAASGDSIPRIVDILLEFRGLNKMLTSFVRPLPALARDESEIEAPLLSASGGSPKSLRIAKIHPMWMQTAVRTGRLSCRKPNMQQIPKQPSFGVAPRNAFCASSEELCLFACDYSQNEVRILAHMSNDPALIAMFGDVDESGEGIDIYKQMASAVNKKPIGEVTDKERSISKQVVLAMLYGMGINQVAKKLSIDRAAAQHVFNSFYARFQGVKQWMEDTKDYARKKGYVTTIAGRRRYLDGIQSSDELKRAQAERQAVNSVIQGSAADLIKMAMLKMASRIMDWAKQTSNYGGTGKPPRLVLQIHDELLFEVVATEEDVQRLKDTVIRCCAQECERDLKLKVPLKLDCSVGKSWGTSMRDF
jgi:DNA polymerase I-like protein with 3'-5' exonuclease and polymerase domains